MTPIDIGYHAIENALCMLALRDEFAAKALQGMLANQHPYRESDEHMFAHYSYTLADAMLAARTQDTK